MDQENLCRMQLPEAGIGTDGLLKFMNLDMLIIKFLSKNWEVN